MLQIVEKINIKSYDFGTTTQSGVARGRPGHPKAAQSIPGAAEPAVQPVSQPLERKSRIRRGWYRNAIRSSPGQAGAPRGNPKHPQGSRAGQPASQPAIGPKIAYTEGARRPASQPAGRPASQAAGMAGVAALAAYRICGREILLKGKEINIFGANIAYTHRVSQPAWFFIEKTDSWWKGVNFRLIFTWFGDMADTIHWYLQQLICLHRFCIDIYMAWWRHVQFVLLFIIFYWWHFVKTYTNLVFIVVLMVFICFLEVPELSFHCK